MDGAGDGAVFDMLQYALAVCPRNEDVFALSVDLPESKPEIKSLDEAASAISAFESTTSEEALLANSFDERVKARAWAVNLMKSRSLGNWDIGRSFRD